MKKFRHQNRRNNRYTPHIMRNQKYFLAAKKRRKISRENRRNRRNQSAIRKWREERAADNQSKKINQNRNETSKKITQRNERPSQSIWPWRERRNIRRETRLHQSHDESTRRPLPLKATPTVKEGIPTTTILHGTTGRALQSEDIPINWLRKWKESPSKSEEEEKIKAPAIKLAEENYYQSWNYGKSIIYGNNQAKSAKPIRATYGRIKHHGPEEEIHGEGPMKREENQSIGKSIFPHLLENQWSSNIKWRSPTIRKSIINQKPTVAENRQCTSIGKIRPAQSRNTLHQPQSTNQWEMKIEKWKSARLKENDHHVGVIICERRKLASAA